MLDASDVLAIFGAGIYDELLFTQFVLLEVLCIMNGICGPGRFEY